MVNVLITQVLSFFIDYFKTSVFETTCGKQDSFSKIRKQFLRYYKVIDIMITHRVMAKVLFILVWLCVLCLSGCANYLKPEIGAIAQEEARIELVEGGVQDALWDTRDLALTYSYSESGNAFNFHGTLVFDRSLSDSFKVKRRFNLKMNFLDREGRVLETIDISPLISSVNELANQDIKIKKSLVRPAGASSIAFNYYGEFRGNDPKTLGDGWEVFYFPFD